MYDELWYYNFWPAYWTVHVYRTQAHVITVLLLPIHLVGSNNIKFASLLLRGTCIRPTRTKSLERRNKIGEFSIAYRRTLCIILFYPPRRHQRPCHPPTRKHDALNDNFQNKNHVSLSRDRSKTVLGGVRWCLHQPQTTMALALQPPLCTDMFKHAGTRIHRLRFTSRKRSPACLCSPASIINSLCGRRMRGLLVDRQ